MQDRTREGYLDVARLLDARVAPVGEAFRWAHRQRPGVPLWAGDGYHPSPIGSYLAACVFYATFYDRSPEGIPFIASLEPADARFAQRAAASVRNAE